ncbi:hypothetical protein WMY93_001661 [Mugilogobius chulae]|uniref:Uncharacterized protein n=1 Tax=Mugilogobius chulae TaxID=88201 RepID=A0AAW0PRZ2_9GOBI
MEPDGKERSSPCCENGSTVTVRTIEPNIADHNSEKNCPPKSILVSLSCRQSERFTLDRFGAVLSPGLALVWNRDTEIKSHIGSITFHLQSSMVFRGVTIVMTKVELEQSLAEWKVPWSVESRLWSSPLCAPSKAVPRNFWDYYAVCCSILVFVPAISLHMLLSPNRGN